MVASRLFSLSPSAKRALPFIERSVRTGVSVSALQTALSGQGMGVRRTELLAAVRFVRGVEIKTNAIRSIRRDRKPDPARIAIARTNIRRQFSFTVRVTGFRDVDGERVERFITLSTDTLLTRAELEAEAASVIEAERGNYPFEIETLTLDKALRRA